MDKHNEARRTTALAYTGRKEHVDREEGRRRDNREEQGHRSGGALIIQGSGADTDEQQGVPQNYRPETPSTTDRGSQDSSIGGSRRSSWLVNPVRFSFIFASSRILKFARSFFLLHDALWPCSSPRWPNRRPSSTSTPQANHFRRASILKASDTGGEYFRRVARDFAVMLWTPDALQPRANGALRCAD